MTKKKHIKKTKENKYHQIVFEFWKFVHSRQREARRMRRRFFRNGSKKPGVSHLHSHIPSTPHTPHSTHIPHHTQHTQHTTHTTHTTQHNTAHTFQLSRPTASATDNSAGFSSVKGEEVREVSGELGCVLDSMRSRILVSPPPAWMI